MGSGGMEERPEARKSNCGEAKGEPEPCGDTKPSAWAIRGILVVGTLTDGDICLA